MILKKSKLLLFTIFILVVHSINAQGSNDSSKIAEAIKIIENDSLQLDTFSFKGIKIIFPKNAKNKESAKEGDNKDLPKEPKKRRWRKPASFVSLAIMWPVKLWIPSRRNHRRPHFLARRRSHRTFAVRICS